MQLNEISDKQLAEMIAEQNRWLAEEMRRDAEKDEMRAGDLKKQTTQQLVDAQFDLSIPFETQLAIADELETRLGCTCEGWCDCHRGEFPEGEHCDCERKPVAEVR